MNKKLLLILLTLALALVPKQLQAEDKTEFDFQSFGKLPVMFSGRFQPIDSLARNSLLQIRERQTANLEPWKDWNEKPKMISAVEWFATVTMNPTVADTWPIFRVDNPELISLLKLPEKDLANKHDGKHYSWNEMLPDQEMMDKFSTEQKRVAKIEASHRNPYERSVSKLHERLILYMRLKSTFQPPNAKNWAEEVKEYESMVPAGIAAVRARSQGREYDEALFGKFADYAQRFDIMKSMEPPLVVPPHHPEKDKDAWMRTGEALLEVLDGEPLHSSVTDYAAIVTAFRNNDVATFNKKVADYTASLQPAFPKELAKVSKEQFFNTFAPFYKAMVLYVIAFLLALFSWFNLNQGLRKSAFYLIAIAFVIHTSGLIFRMWLEGRPPVTNLYSSAIFIGWGAVILGMILERFFKDGIGSVVASTVGFLTLIVAHNLSMGGDTMAMLQAVLDTNFWLATHVVVVTLGYASTFVAGFLALIYLGRGVFTNTLNAETGKNLSRMVYGIICFATLFSFVGTVLGGIWADQSWGRFWGWDPKENGALIIVIWNALILHARWGGMVKDRGIMNLAIFGNVVTAWSWFGTNMLGIGLHSYGFMDSAFKYLMLFIVSQLVLIGLGCLPLKYWGSGKNLIKNDDEPVSKPGKKGSPAGKQGEKLATA